MLYNFFSIVFLSINTNYGYFFKYVSPPGDSERIIGIGQVSLVIIPCFGEQRPRGGTVHTENGVVIVTKIF